MTCKIRTSYINNSLSWYNGKDDTVRFATSSYNVPGTSSWVGQAVYNSINIVEKAADSDAITFAAKAQTRFPISSLRFAPASHGKPNQLLATSDSMQLYELNTEEKKLVLVKSFELKQEKFLSPFTGLDWNHFETNKCVACSFDTTCVLFDLEAEKKLVELIAHDVPVHDVAFCKDPNTFITCGADGSVRLFDTRDLEHSVIVYGEPSGAIPVRCVPGLMNDDILVVSEASNQFHLIDLKMARPPSAIDGHTKPVNDVCWAPYNNDYYASCGEDGVVNIFCQGERHLTYEADPNCAINCIGWSNEHSAYVAITTTDGVELLRI